MTAPLSVNVLEVRPLRKHLVHQTKQQLKNRESSGHSSNNTEYYDFFERLAEKEGERELKSQETVFAMVKEVAKIFKRQ